MRLRKQVLPILLLVGIFLVAAPFVEAQTSRVKIDGSPMLFVFSQTSALSFMEQSDAEVLVNISGTDAAIEALCANTLDIANSDRAITDEELDTCAANGVQVIELEIAVNGVGIVSNNAEQSCYALDDLATVFGSEGPAVVGRGREYEAYLANKLDLDALRSDFEAYGDDAGVEGALADASAEMVGSVSLLGALSGGSAPLAIDAGAGCVTPTTETIADESYALSGKLYMYVSVGSGEQIAVANFIEHTLSPENLSNVTQLGLLPLDDEVYTKDRQNWQLRTPSRTFTITPTAIMTPDYSLDLMALGEGADVTIAAGIGEIMQVADEITAGLTQANSDLQFIFNTTSTETAMSQLCNGEVDMAGARRSISDAEIAACAENDVEFMELLVGLNPLIVVTSPENDFASCISMNTLNLIFGADNEGSIVRWEQMREGYPPYDLAVYVPEGPEVETFQSMMGPTRADVTGGDVINAVRIDPSGVGYVSLLDYVNAQDKVLGISLDAGAGCVIPAAETVQNGAYPLTQPLYLYVNGESFERPAVQVLTGELLSGEYLPAAGYMIPPIEQYGQMIGIFREGTLGPVFSRGAAE